MRTHSEATAGARKVSGHSGTIRWVHHVCRASGLVQARADGIIGALQRERAYQGTERAMQENGTSRCLSCHQSADPN